MTAPHRALIVIDPQREYFTGRLPIAYPPRDTSIARIGAAIDAAEAAGIPVVMVQHSSGEGAPVFAPGTDGYRLHASLEARDGSGWTSIVKQHGSVFPGTDLDAWVAENGIDTITLAGYMTNNCVLATAADAETRSLAVEVLADATGAIDIENAAGSANAQTVHATLLALLHSNLAAVVETDDWIAAVQSGASLATDDLVSSAAAGAATHKV